MRDWIDVERLQWDGCCAIWQVDWCLVAPCDLMRYIVQAASENSQAREELGTLGAADVLVRAMERYPESEKIIERACWAITGVFRVPSVSSKTNCYFFRRSINL